MSGDVLSLLAGLAVVGVFVGSTLLASDGLALERRAGRLQRSDPATAEALRRAQAVTDFSRGGVFGDEAFGIVCTPSRRTWFEVASSRASDDDPPPPARRRASRPAPIVLASGEHLVGEHLATGRRMPQPPRSVPMPPRPARVDQSAAGGANSPGHQDAASG